MAIINVDVSPKQNISFLRNFIENEHFKLELVAYALESKCVKKTTKF